MRAAPGTPAAADALAVARAAADLGAQDEAGRESGPALRALFFSSAGAAHALRSADADPWRQLAQRSGAELLVCASGALEQGARQGADLAEDFEASGLAELTLAARDGLLLCFQ